MTLKELRKACLADFFTFVRVMNPPPKGSAPISRKIHKPLCDVYGDPNNYYFGITMPRAWLKSTIFTKWGPVWRYLRDPEERILIAAENEKLAGRFLQWIETQILTNRRLRTIFPELQQVDKAYTKLNPWSKSECLLPRKGLYSEPTITAIGVGGAAQSGHYTTIQIDDLVGKKAAESQLVLETVMAWFDNVDELLVEPSPSMPHPSRVIIIGTFWFPGDFLCYVQQTYKKYRFYITPCRRYDVVDDDMTKWIQNPDVDFDESNWPEQFPTSYYIEMLQNPEKELIYWSQHMNMPRKSGALNKFKMEWLRYWHHETDGDVKYIVFENPDGTPLERVREQEFAWRGVLDPGGFSPDTKLKKGASRNAIVVGGQKVGDYKKVLRHTWAQRFKDPDALMDAFFGAHKETKPVVWRQEIYGQQRYIMSDIKKEAVKRGIPLSLIELPSDMTKDQKDLSIQALIEPFFRGEFYIHRSMKEFIAEYTTYPNGMTKDLLDALAQLFRHYMRRGSKEDLEAVNARNHERTAPPVRPAGSYVGY